MLYMLGKVGGLLQDTAANVRTDEPNVGVVVVTGLVLVFGILFLLFTILTVEGKIFSSLDKKKQERAAQNVPKAAPKAAVVAAKPAVPKVETGIPPEVVAAIVAAVDASTGGGYTLRSVKTVKKGRGRWGLAGVIQSTEPF